MNDFWLWYEALSYLVVDRRWDHRQDEWEFYDDWFGELHARRKGG